MGFDQDDKARSVRINEQRAAGDRLKEEFATESGQQQTRYETPCPLPLGDGME